MTNTLKINNFLWTAAGRLEGEIPLHSLPGYAKFGSIHSSESAIAGFRCANRSDHLVDRQSVKLLDGGLTMRLIHSPFSASSFLLTVRGLAPI